MKLEGTVTSGLGRGRQFVTLDGYFEQFQMKLGYEPYPGTLNVETAGSTRDQFEELAPIVIDEWNDGEDSYGAVHCYPATLESVEGREEDRTHILIPKRTDHDDTVLELVAPVKLRDVLDLSDGSRVTVRAEGR